MLLNLRKNGGACLVSLSLCLAWSAAAMGADLSGRWVWQPVRIGAGGWMRGMAINPQDPAVRLARGDVDNAYRWDAARNTWVAMKVAGALPAAVSAAPASAGCSALALDPSDPNVVLCADSFDRSADIRATYPNIPFNVYRSTDGGRTFTAGNLSLSGNTVNEMQGERLAIDPNNGRIVYLGTPASGLYRSLNGGSTWAAVVGSPRAARFPRFDAGGGKVSVGGLTGSRRLYCTTTGGPIYRSDDGGTTWSSISAGQGMDGHPGFATVDQNGTFWVAQDSDTSGSRTVYRYSRAGAWSSSDTPGGSVNGIAVDPKNASRVFVLAQGGALGRSNDGGRTWTSLGGPSYSATQPIQWLRPSATRPSGHYESISNLFLDKNGSLWTSGGNDGVLTCKPGTAPDSAANPPVWTSSSAGIEEMVAQSCVLPPGGSPVLSAEDETSFTIQNPDAFTALHFDINLWGGGGNGLSTAQDISFCPNQPKFIAVTTANVFTADPAATNYAAYSADGGRHWARFGSILSGTHPAPLFDGTIAVSARRPGHQGDRPGGDNIVWIGSNIYSAKSPAPFYSTDGGKSWAQTASFRGVPGASVYKGYEYMGNQWGPWNPALKVHDLEADPLAPGVFYAELAGGGFWKSGDGGKTWGQSAGARQLPGLAHHGQLRANLAASGDLWFADGYEGATAHGLWHTTDGGNSFTRIAGFDYCWALALGRARSAGGYPAVYAYGKRTGNPQWGVFASFDQGRTWDQIAGYPTGLIDAPSGMAASWDTFGTIYVGFHGNSFVYGRYAARSHERRPLRVH